MNTILSTSVTTRTATRMICMQELEMCRLRATVHAVCMQDLAQHMISMLYRLWQHVMFFAALQLNISDYM